MSQERVKELSLRCSKSRIFDLLELASQELELIKNAGTEEEKNIIIDKIRNNNIRKFNEIPESLRKDEDVFRELLNNDIFFTDLNQQIFDVFGIDLFVELLENKFERTIKYLNYCPDFRDDIRVAKVVLCRNIQYQYCIPKLHSDIDFAIELIKFNPELYHKTQLKGNRRLMTEYLFATADIDLSSHHSTRLFIKDKTY